MEKENGILTPGQKAVIDGYLKAHKPADSFNVNTCRLYDTQTIIDDLSLMCDFTQNSLSDYLASVGCKFHYDERNGIFGWIFEFTEND